MSIPNPLAFGMTDPSVLQRLDALEQDVLDLKASRPGRRGKPILVSEKGVCGVDPDCDSATCEASSVYRKQKGCKGTACEQKYNEYYSLYRKAKRGTGEAEVE